MLCVINVKSDITIVMQFKISKEIFKIKILGKSLQIRGKPVFLLFLKGFLQHLYQLKKSVLSNTLKFVTL